MTVIDEKFDTENEETINIQMTKQSLSVDPQFNRIGLIQYP